MEKKKVLIRVKLSTADKLEEFSNFKKISKSEYVAALIEFMDLLQHTKDIDFLKQTTALLDQSFIKALTPDHGNWIKDTAWAGK